MTSQQAPLVSHTALLLARTFIFAIMIYVLLCDAALAKAATNPSGMTGTLCSVIRILQGPLGAGMATLAVVSVGISAVLGKGSWGMALTVTAGIVVLFSAMAITTFLLPGNANPCGTSVS